MKAGSPKGGIVAVGAAIAAIALLVTQVETLHDAWCKYFGLFCTFKVVSPPIAASSGGSPGPYVKDAQCREKYVPICVSPSTTWRTLDLGSGKFAASSSVGRYDDGLALNDPKLPTGERSPEVGWYPKSETPAQICVEAFTRTGGCEVLHSIAGRLEATEHISLW